jgi:hypothetical protein
MVPPLQVITCTVRNKESTYVETGATNNSSNSTESGRPFLKGGTRPADSTFVNIIHFTRKNVKPGTYQ